MDTCFQGDSPVTLVDTANLSFTPVFNSRRTDMAGEYVAVYMGGCRQGDMAQYTASVPLFFGYATFPIPDPGGVGGADLSYSCYGSPPVPISEIISSYAGSGFRTGPETLARRALAGHGMGAGNGGPFA